MYCGSTESGGDRCTVLFIVSRLTFPDQSGANVVVIDKSPFCGGNSTKATSGINAGTLIDSSCRAKAACRPCCKRRHHCVFPFFSQRKIFSGGTRAQNASKIADSAQAFYEDTMKSARHLARPELIRVLTYDSADCVHWLEDKFALDMSVLGRLGGHSYPRTHRGKEQFPGMTITYALMEKIEEISKAEPKRARVINRAKVSSYNVQDAHRFLTLFTSCHRPLVC